MKRLIGVLIMTVFCLAFSNCGKRVESVPGEPTVDATAPVAASSPAVTYVVDTMDSGYTVGSVIGGKYYLSACGNHDFAFTNFRRGHRFARNQGLGDGAEFFQGHVWRPLHVYRYVRTARQARFVGS